MSYSIAIGTAKLKWLNIVMLLLTVILATIYTTYSFRAKRCKYAYPLICPLNIHCPNKGDHSNVQQYTFPINNIPTTPSTMSIGYLNGGTCFFTLEFLPGLSPGSVPLWNSSLGSSNVHYNGLCVGYYLQPPIGSGSKYSGASVFTLGFGDNGDNNSANRQILASIISDALNNKNAGIERFIYNTKSKINSTTPFVINLTDDQNDQSLCITASTTKIIGSEKIKLNVDSSYQAVPGPVVPELKRIKTQKRAGCSVGASHLCTCVDPSYETMLFTCPKAKWCPNHNWFIYGKTDCSKNYQVCSDETSINKGCSAPFCRTQELAHPVKSGNQTYQKNAGTATTGGGIGSFAAKRSTLTAKSYTVQGETLKDKYGDVNPLDQVQLQQNIFCRGHTHSDNNVGGNSADKGGPMGQDVSNTEKPIHARFPNSNTDTGDTIILGFN